MVLRLELRLLFNSKNSYGMTGKIRIVTTSPGKIRGGICSPISLDDFPAGGSFSSGSAKASHSGKVVFMSWTVHATD